MRVTLISEGGYSGLETCVGKEFDAVAEKESAVSIPLQSLLTGGYINDGSITEGLFFFGYEVEVIDG